MSNIGKHLVTQSGWSVMPHYEGEVVSETEKTISCKGGPYGSRRHRREVDDILFASKQEALAAIERFRAAWASDTEVGRLSDELQAAKAVRLANAKAALGEAVP